MRATTSGSELFKVLEVVAAGRISVFQAPSRRVCRTQELRASELVEFQVTASFPERSQAVSFGFPGLAILCFLAAAGAGANNGGVALWIDGVQRGSLSGLDNDTRRIERVRLGAASSVDAGTIGTYYLDSFESRRQTYIGP